MRGDDDLARPWPTVKTPTGKIVVSEQNYVVCERWEVCVGPIGRQENQEVDVFNVKSIDSWRTVAIRSFKPTYTKTNLRKLSDARRHTWFLSLLRTSAFYNCTVAKW